MAAARAVALDAAKVMLREAVAAEENDRAGGLTRLRGRPTRFDALARVDLLFTHDVMLACFVRRVFAVFDVVLCRSGGGTMYSMFRTPNVMQCLGYPPRVEPDAELKRILPGLRAVRRYLEPAISPHRFPVVKLLANALREAGFARAAPNTIRDQLAIARDERAARMAAHHVRNAEQLRFRRADSAARWEAGRAERDARLKVERDGT